MPQLVIAAVGAVAGNAAFGAAAFSFAGLSVSGAQLGWTVGSLIGSQFGPAQKAQGPRLTDLSVSSSAYGTPIPYTQGSPRLSGQVIWASTKREIATTTRSGGKGGRKQKVTTYTYEVDLLYLLTDNEIPGVTRIWINGKLIWNKLPAADAATLAASDATTAWTGITIYTGAPTQGVDPIYEASVGAANAPAYRGRGTVMIEGLQLGSSGAIPNLTFELGSQAPVLSAGDPSLVCSGTFVTQDSVDLSATKAVVLSRETSSVEMDAITVNNPSGTTITHGSLYTPQSGNNANPRVDKISATKAIATWNQNTGSLLGYAAILNISGDVITTVTPVSFASFVADAGVVSMSSTQAVVVYYSGGIKAMVLDINGSDLITTNAAFSSGLPTSGVSNLSVCKLSSTTVFVTWIASGSPYVLRGVVLTLSGGTFASGGVMDLTNDAVTGLGTGVHLSVALTSASALVMCGQQTTNYPQGTIVTTAGGATDPYLVANYVVAYSSMAKISGSFALAVFCRQSDGHLQAAVLGAAPGAITTLVAASTTYPTVAMISTSKAIVTYIDSASDLRSLVVTLT